MSEKNKMDNSQNGYSSVEKTGKIKKITFGSFDWCDTLLSSTFPQMDLGTCGDWCCNGGGEGDICSCLCCCSGSKIKISWLNQKGKWGFL